MPNETRARAVKSVLEPPHQHTIQKAGESLMATCRCGQWSTTGTTSDELAQAFRRHVESAQGVLL